MKVLSVDGLSKLISLMKEDFAESSSLSTVATTGSYSDLTNKPVEIPSQSGNSGKFLTTNGTSVSWATVDALPLSGGTLTGTLTFDSIPNAIKIKSSGNGHIKFTNTSGNTAYGYIYGSSSGVGIYSPNLNKYIFFSDNGIYGNSTNTLGTSSDKWSKIYATTLNNGNDISIPTSSGTLALTSQLPSIATTSTTGLVKPDGTSITITNDGTITAVGGGGGSSYTAGTGIDITNDVISVTSPTLQNNTNINSSLAIFGNTSGYTNSIAIGNSSIADGGSSIALGISSKSYGNSVSIGKSSYASNQSVAIGYEASTGSSDAGSVLLGDRAKITGTKSSGNMAIGRCSEIICINSGEVSNLNIALGNSAKVGDGTNRFVGTIQLGYGTNTEQGSFYVALTDDYGVTWNNYKLLGSDGKIPNARLNTMTGADGTNAGTKGAVPAPAATDNTKFLRGDGTWATVSGGGSSLPDQTGNSGKFLTTNGSTASWATVSISTVDQTYDGTSVNAQSGAAIAGAGFLTNNTSSPYSWVISNTASNQDGLTILGKDSSATKARSTVLGRSAQSTGKTGIVIGYAAYVSADHAIQIGTGTNSTADTLSIGFDNDTTANRKNWTLLDGTTGLIPDARISTNIARTSDISGKQDISNLVTSLSSSSTDSQYPSAKCVYDLIGNLESILNNINNGNIS